MSLSLRLMGPDTEGVLKIWILIPDSIPGARRTDHRDIRPAPGALPRTSGCRFKKSEIPASSSSGANVQVEYTILPPGFNISAALSRISCWRSAQSITFASTPLISGLFIFPEHPLSGARRIHDHTVKKLRKNAARVPESSICHDSVANSHTLQILGRNFCPRRMDFIADQEVRVLPGVTRMCVVLPPGAAHRSSTRSTRLWSKQSHNCHGTRFLNVIYSCFMVRMASRTALRS